MEMKEVVIFFNSIYASTLENIENESLSKEIYRIKSIEKGSIVSNQGGWQSTSIKEADLVPGSQMELLYENVLPRVAKVFELWKISETFSLDSFWCNVNSKGDFNWEHNHPLSKMSAVYYVKTSDETGDIVFLRPDEQESYIIPKEITPYTFKTYRISPKNGLLLIFPSYLRHRVGSNNSDTERISIAFNFS